VAVAFDAVGPSSAGGGTTGATTATTASWSHTCSGVNLVVVVGVAIGANPSGSVTTTATFGGVSMTSLGLVAANNQTAGYVQLFSLVGPATGASTVALTVSTASTITAGSVSFTGASGVGTAVTAFGSSTAPSVTVTGTTSGNMVVDAVCTGTAVSSSTQTPRWLKNTNGATAGGCGASATAAGGGSVAMGYAITNDWWGAIAVEVLAAAAATAPRRLSVQSQAVLRASFR